MYIYIIIATLLPKYGMGQSDSLFLTYNEFIENLILFHPIAKKAALQENIAAAEWLSSKGQLDPKLAFNWNEKNFDKKLYYQVYQGKFKIPTRLGIDVVGGYENSDGVFLNPERKTDEFGLWHLGVEINLLQGLITNERSIALRKAKVYQKMTENERLLILNELILDASYAYFKWVEYFFSMEVYEKNKDLASQYLNNTKISFLNGEKSEMDTLEAHILLQDAENSWQKNYSKYTKSQLKLENFLWFDDVPLALASNTFPVSYEENILEISAATNIEALVNQNPSVLHSLNKKEIYEIEQRLKREKLKPKLKAKYNPLLATSTNSVTPNFALSDYKWGIDFSMPLLFRKERADLQKSEIKIKETVLDIDNKKNKLSNKIENSIVQLDILNQQINLLERNVVGYQKLLDGENEKFKYGESSIFLLNKRQEKYINGLLKLIKLHIETKQEKLNYLFLTNGFLK